MSINLIIHEDWQFSFDRFNNCWMLRAFKWELVVCFNEPSGFV